MAPDIEGLHGRRSTDADLAVILRRLDEQDETLRRIFEQTARTNGRVSALEIAKATEEAVRRDRAERLEEERGEERDADEKLNKRQTRTLMVVAATCSLCSSAVGYLFLSLAHIHP